MFGKGKISFGNISFNIGKKKASHDEEKNNAVHEKVEKEIGSFGKFGAAKIASPTTEESKPLTSAEENVDLSAEATTSVEAAMGFASFGKSGSVTELERIVEESKKIAHDRNRERLEKLDLEAEANKNDNDDNCILPNRLSDTQNEELQSNDDSNSSDSEEDIIGPPVPPDMESTKQNNEEEDEEGSDEDDEVEDHKLPISHEFSLNHGSKIVSALAVDPSGSRLVSGATDYEVKYWDFQGMDLSKEAFRSFRPADGYPINSAAYSCTGDKVLIVSGSAQAKVYDRDGVEVYECVRGDMYLHDMAKTKGHIGGLTDGKWHPKNKEEFMTSGRDGTCRLWYTSRPLEQVHVIKPRALNGLRTNPTACSYSQDGLVVACACDDGSVQMWDHRKNYVNTSFHIRNAHSRGSETSCISFSYDAKAFATRGGDETLKLWDIRKNRSPLYEINDLLSMFSMTDCLFSPDDKLVVTGTSVEKGDDTGKLKYFCRNTGELVSEMKFASSHIVRIIWHPRLNQIMLGCGDGKIRILYDPKNSRNGALLVMGKHKKRVKQAEVVQLKQVIIPHSLPLFREERHKSSRKLEEKDRKNPVRSHQPELPLGKTGSGGRVSSGGSTLSSYIIRNMGIRNKVREEGDPREALLKHAKEAADSPYWVSPAYAKTQPKPIFQCPDGDDGHQAKKQKKE